MLRDGDDPTFDPGGCDADTGIIVVVGVVFSVNIERIVMEDVDNGDGIGVSHDELENDILALNLMGIG